MTASKIEWTEHTWNPIIGCSIVSPGCSNCYAMTMARRLELMGQERYAGLTKMVNGNAVWTGKLALAPEKTLLEPLRRKKPTTWFVNSMGDLFHEDCPDEWIDHVFAIMLVTPKHIYQVLTKRSARMRAYCSSNEAMGRILSIANAWITDGNTTTSHRPDVMDAGNRVYIGVITENGCCSALADPQDNEMFLAWKAERDAALAAAARTYELTMHGATAPAQAEPVGRALKTLKWIAEQRWDENADLDTICTAAERALASATAQDQGGAKSDSGPMTPIERVRCALAIADAGYAVGGVELEDAEELLQAHDALTARVAELEKALEPFAELADEGNDDQPDETKVTVQAGRSTCYGLTLKELRAARAAYVAMAKERRE